MRPKWLQSLSKHSPVKDSLNGKAAGETPTERAFFQKAMVLILGLLILLFLSFMLSFFVAVRGAEKTLVPNVVGVKLIDALIDLQEKELYPRIQVRFTEDPMEKDHIIQQDPQPGSVVRAGRRIKLTVSKGAVVDSVGDYIGKDLREVKTLLQTQFASHKPLLIIKEPVTYVFDEAPAGTILEQRPPAGTQITGLTEITMIVSRGPIGDSYKLDDYQGLRWQDALNRLVRSEQPFRFLLREGEGKERDALVVAQKPAAGDIVLSGTPVQLELTAPARLGQDERFGLFELALPNYPIAVDIVVEKVLTGGKRQTVLEMKYPGGTFSFPYRDEVGSQYAVKIYDKEVRTFTVQ